MKSPRIHSAMLAGWLLSAVACAATLSAAPAARVTHLVPADAPLVIHVRSLPELRKAWNDTSFSRAWVDPEIRRFLAPMIDQLTDAESGFAATMQRDTGLSPEEFLALFPGEAVMALKDFSPYFRNEQEGNPQLLFAIEIGDTADKLKAALARGRDAAASKGEAQVEEEFQGETLHITVKPLKDDPDTRVEAEAWVIVDRLFIMGSPKSVVQEAVAGVKKGGVQNPLALNPAFAALYQKSPDTHAMIHVGLDSFIPSIVEMLERSQGQTDANGNPTGPAAQLAAIGQTPKSLFNILGLDALQSFDLSVAFRDSGTVIEGGVRWSEQRGLLRMAAFGEPPVARPEFIPDSWVYAGVDRFSVPTAYRALMETLAELSPMLDGFVRQQIKGINTQLGIDLQRDLIDSLGDVMVSGYALPPSGKVSTEEPLDQFVSVSLSNPEAFSRAIDALIGGSPLGQMLKPREYLGETIRDASVPNGKPFAISITQGHLLVSIGGPAMVESAIQGMRGGAARPFWKKTEVVNAVNGLPGGASSILVTDLGRMMNVLVDLLISATPDSDEASDMDTDVEEGEDGAPAARRSSPVRVDASARPSAETIAKYWSMMARGLYIDSNGIRITIQMAHGR